MSKKKSAESETAIETYDADGPEGNDGELTIANNIQPRASNEVLPCVEAASQTIVGCSDAEMKNFLATADYAARQFVVQLADHWKGICKTAANAGKDDKPAKVKVAYGVEIDHTNVLMMDTRVTLAYSEKHVSSDDTQEDLTQTEFALSH
jgi:hypothetical protein